MIKYIGSKRVLVPLITEVVRGLEPRGSVVDLFSGTSRVGHALKAAGFQVFANDLNSYAATIARCYVQSDLEDLAADAARLINEMRAVPGKAGYFTQTFCIDGLYFQPKNGARIDAMRDWIADQQLGEELEAVLLVSLMEAADRVDSTTGVQMAFLKQWAPRAFNDLELRMPAVLERASSGKGRAYQMEAQDAAKTISADIGYLDPPYNQHKYIGNYHIWETLVRWDAPEAYGVARKRIDCRERKSSFNSKPRIHDAVASVIENLDVRHLVVSFNNEGYVSRDEMVELLSKRGDVFVIERDFKRYVGAQIGIYNPDGNKVGRVSHLANKEYLFLVPEDPDKLRLPRESYRSVDELVPGRTRPLAAPSPAKTQHRLAAGSRRELLIKSLREEGSLSSSEARRRIGGSSSEEFRAIFHALLAERLIHKTGQRRGTVYHWGMGVDEASGKSPDVASASAAVSTQKPVTMSLK